MFMNILKIKYKYINILLYYNMNKIRNIAIIGTGGFSRELKCHIITVPPQIIEKIEKFGKTFKKLTVDTVKAFLVDSKKSKFKI